MKTLIKIAIIATVSISCNRHECHNANPVLDTAEPKSATYKYKQELAKQLDKRGAFTFILTGYDENNNIPKLHVDIHGSTLCAKTIVSVLNSNKSLQNILKNKGVGYHGAELEDLEIELDPATNEFVFKGLHDIID